MPMQAGIEAAGVCYHVLNTTFSFKVIDARIDACPGNSKLVFIWHPASSLQLRYQLRQCETSFSQILQNERNLLSKEESCMAKA